MKSKNHRRILDLLLVFIFLGYFIIFMNLFFINETSFEDKLNAVNGSTYSLLQEINEKKECFNDYHSLTISLMEALKNIAIN